MPHVPFFKKSIMPGPRLLTTSTDVPDRIIAGAKACAARWVRGAFLIQDDTHLPLAPFQEPSAFVGSNASSP